MAELIAWWIDQDTGYQFPSGPAWCATFAFSIPIGLWGDSADELLDRWQSRSSDRHEDQIRPSRDVHRTETHRQPRIDGGRSGILANLKALRRSSRRDCSAAVEKSGRLPGQKFPARVVSRSLMLRRSGAQVVRHWDLAATVKTDRTIPTGRSV